MSTVRVADYHRRLGITPTPEHVNVFCSKYTRPVRCLPCHEVHLALRTFRSSLPERR